MPVLVLILESAEATLLDEWAALLPTITRLRAESAGFRVNSLQRLMPDSVLPEISCGCSVARTGVYNVLARLHTGERHARVASFEEEQARPYYWTLADRAGRRVAVLDHSWGSAGPDFAGLFIKSFGLHHVDTAARSVPAPALEELRNQFGAYPVKLCDAHYERTLPDHERLLADLLEGLNIKERMITGCMKRDEWDLVSATLSELHCAGHQFWYLHDANHPDHVPNAPQRLEDALRTVYIAVDAAVGRILEAAGPEATTVVVAPRGMQHKACGEEMLPEFVHRLGLGSGRWLRMKLGFMAPRSLKKFICRLVPQSTLNRLQLGLNSRMGTFADNRTKVIAVDNAGVGALRLNVVGREADGAVQPGAGYDELISLLREELAALRDLRTGEPAVERVVAPSELYGDDHHPDLPDLLVAFRTDLGVLEGCTSPRVGIIRRPDPPARTGDHTDHGRMWIRGPGIDPTPTLAEANTLDVAPTILDLLDAPGDPAWTGRSVFQAVRAPCR